MFNNNNKLYYYYLLYKFTRLELSILFTANEIIGICSKCNCFNISMLMLLVTRVKIFQDVTLILKTDCIQVFADTNHLEVLNIVFFDENISVLRIKNATVIIIIPVVVDFSFQ